MKHTTALYQTIHADVNHTKEMKAVIAGVEYEQERIFSCSITGSLYAGDQLAIGGTVSREVSLSLIPTEEIPRMAEIKLYSRVRLKEQVSEWVPDGVFFIDTREEDAVTHILTMHAYDSMLKAETVWLDPSQDTGEWPVPMTAALRDIARRMGVEIDPRTAIEPTYQVEYPNDYTMREILGFIAAAHIGNFAVTDEGKLLLLPVGALPPETRYLAEGQTGASILFGEVRILV